MLLVVTWVFPTWLCSPVFAPMVDSRAEGLGLGVQDWYQRVSSNPMLDVFRVLNQIHDLCPINQLSYYILQAVLRGLRLDGLRLAIWSLIFRIKA